MIVNGKFRTVDVSADDLTKTAKPGLLLFILTKWEYMNLGSGSGGSGQAGACTRSMSIGEGGATSLTSIPSPTGEGMGAWYNLQGRRLNGNPARKGLYIHQGRKVVVK